MIGGLTWLGRALGMPIAWDLILEYLKVLVSWPVAAVVVAGIFQKPISDRIAAGFKAWWGQLGVEAGRAQAVQESPEKLPISPRKGPDSPSRVDFAG